MKNIFFLCVLLLGSSTSIFAQKENTTHQIVLKDGNFLKGHLVTTQDADPVIIKTFGGAEIIISQEHIDQVVFINSDQKILNDGRTINKSKSYSTIMVGLMPKVVELWDGKDVRFGFNAIHISTGYQFNKFLGVGAGLNWDVYDLHIMSLHTELRGKITEKSISPYYVLQGGYGFIMPIELNQFPEDTEFKGGLMFHPAIGLEFATRKQANILLEVGYRFQKTSREWENWDKYFDKITYRRLSLRFGVTF